MNSNPVDSSRIGTGTEVMKNTIIAHPTTDLHDTSKPEKTLDHPRFAHYNRTNFLVSSTCLSRCSANADLTALPRRSQGYPPSVFLHPPTPRIGRLE